MEPRNVQDVVGADVLQVAGAEREAAAGVRAVEEGMPVQLTARQVVLGVVQIFLRGPRLVRLQRGRLLGLRLLDERGARRLGLLRSGRRNQTRSESNAECRSEPHSSLPRLTRTPPPPGTASGATDTVLLRKRMVTVRPLAIPMNAPNTTSLVQCLSWTTREAAV